MIKKLLQYTLGQQNGTPAKPGGAFKIVDGELIEIEKSKPAPRDSAANPPGKKPAPGDPDAPSSSKKPAPEKSGQSGKQKSHRMRQIRKTTA